MRQLGFYPDGAGEHFEFSATALVAIGIAAFVRRSSVSEVGVEALR